MGGCDLIDTDMDDGGEEGTTPNLNDTVVDGSIDLSRERCFDHTRWEGHPPCEGGDLLVTNGSKDEKPSKTRV